MLYSRFKISECGDRHLAVDAFDAAEDSRDESKWR